MSSQNFIGSKISLISKKDIRYVGTLRAIDSQNSTITLEHVQSLGTEGRSMNPDEVVPPIDNVFEYIIFSGNDVKDLQVFEPPPPVYSRPPPPTQQYYGHVGPSYTQQPYPLYTTGPPMMYPGYAPHYPMPGQPLAPPPSQPDILDQRTNAFRKPEEILQPAPPLMEPAANMPTMTMTLNAEQNNPSPSTSDAHPVKPDVKDENGLPEPVSEVPRKALNISSIEELARSVSELGIGKTSRGTPKDRDRKNTEKPSSTSRGGESGVSPRNRKAPSNKKSNQPSSVPADFDFGSSNAKFNKADESFKLPEDNGTFYNKSESFFDNISCETKERKDQKNNDFRRKRSEEKKLNLETFGQVSVDQGRGRNNNHRPARGGKRRPRNDKQPTIRGTA